MKYGIAIPQTLLDQPFTAYRWQSFMQRAEALGFEALWTSESVLGTTPFLETLTLLSYAAAATQKIRLGVAVLIVGLREPLLLAKQLSTLDVLSHGRLDVGVGMGHTAAIYPAYGLSPEHRVTRFEDALTLIKALWTQDPVSRDALFYKVQDAHMEPKPVQKPHPLVWFGGSHPDALRRAARMGDAFMGAGSSTVETFLKIVPQLKQFLVEEKRELMPIGKRVYLSLGDDLPRLQRWFGAIYGHPEWAETMAVYGSVGKVVDTLGRLQEAGATYLLLNPVFDEEEQMERLAAEVIPDLPH